MKLTESEPKERTFTLELSETELRELMRLAQTHGGAVGGSLISLCLLLGVKP